MITVPGTTGGPSTAVATDASDFTDAAATAVTLSGERLLVGSEWVASGRLHVRRRVVTEKRMVEVSVRREEVVFETFDVSATSTSAIDAASVDADAATEVLRGTALGGPAVAGPDDGGQRVVVVLREEVPHVSMQVRAYEQVTVMTRTLTERINVGGSVAHEEAVLDVESSANR